MAAGDTAYEWGFRAGALWQRRHGTGEAAANALESLARWCEARHPAPQPGYREVELMDAIAAEARSRAKKAMGGK